MKRTVVIVMFVVVALLSAAAIFIGLRLRQPQSTLPDYIFAEGNNCCNTSGYQTCDEDAEWVAGYNACVAGQCSACQGGGPQCGNGQCESGETSSNCSADCGTSSSSSSGGGTQCSNCGGSGESCCAPENCSGHICDSGLACDSGSGTCTDTGACLEGGTPSNNCMIYTCPNGCSDFGGGALECRQNGQAGSCNTQLSGCGQIDLLNTSGSFCQVISNTCSNTGCGPTGSSSSSGGNTCGNGTVNSGEECDPDATPNGCGTGEQCLTNCTCAVEPTDSVITKVANQSCNPDGTTSTITYTITASNNGSSELTIDIVDTLDPDITQYIDEDSITGGGIFNEAGDEIAWADQVIPAGEDLIVTYNAVVPRTIFGTVLTNTVEMLEGTTVLDSAEASITPTCELPETALISDSVDRILIGVLLVLFGVLIVRFDLMSAGYRLFMNLGGRNIVASFDENERKVVTDKKARRMEKRLLRMKK